MSIFRTIDFSVMPHETIRDYFFINKSGKLSFIAKFLYCVIWPLKTSWDSFELYRQKIWLISQCGWILGQLQNVLNLIYEPINHNITVSQSVVPLIYAPVFAETTTIFAKVFGETTVEFSPPFTDSSNMYPCTINIPSSLHLVAVTYNDLISTIEKIRPAGIIYNISIF